MTTDPVRNADHSDAFADDAYSAGDARTLPPVPELLSPRNLWHWLLGMTESWLLSRNYRQLLLGLPFAVCFLGLVALFWWLKYAPMDDVLQSFESRYNRAVKDEDIETQELCLSGLMNLRPRVPEYRLRLGQFLVSQGREEAGLAYILSLTPDDGDGFAPARMWLARQSQLEDPVMELTADQYEGQLLRVVRDQSDNVDAHRMLAELYIDKQEWRLAEKHLADAAARRPELSLALAKVKQSLDRPTEDILEILGQAETALTERHAENRFDVTTRIALAEAKLMLGRQDEARELLVSGLRNFDSPELRRALADFDLMVAGRRLAQSSVNRDIVLRLVLDALRTDPGNVRAVPLLSRLSAMGSTAPPAAVEPAVTHWQQQLESPGNERQERIVLSQLFALSDRPDEAAEALEPLLDEHPDLRLRYAALLQTAGRHSESRELQQRLLEETRLAAESDPDDRLAAVRHVEALILARRLHEALEFLRSRSETSEGSRAPQDPALNQLYGTVCIDLYDLSRRNPDELQGEEPLELLREALTVRSTVVQAIDRLARLAFSDDPQAAAADELIRKFRIAADTRGEVLSLLGLHALQSGETGRARNYLEQANAQARGRNVMILNNLAIVLIRGEPADPDRALELIDQALQMSPDHPDLLSTRGEIYIAMQRWHEAAADLKRSLASRDDNVEVHRLLVEVYTALNEDAMADGHRRRIRELQGT